MPHRVSVSYFHYSDPTSVYSNHKETPIMNRIRVENLRGILSDEVKMGQNGGRESFQLNMFIAI
jgi:hypothetical protein